MCLQSVCRIFRTNAFASPAKTMVGSRGRSTKRGHGGPLRKAGWTQCLFTWKGRGRAYREMKSAEGNRRLVLQGQDQGDADSTGGPGNGVSAEKSSPATPSYPDRLAKPWAETGKRRREPWRDPLWKEHIQAWHYSKINYLPFFFFFLTRLAEAFLFFWHPPLWLEYSNSKTDISRE